MIEETKVGAIGNNKVENFASGTEGERGESVTGESEHERATLANSSNVQERYWSLRCVSLLQLAETASETASEKNRRSSKSTVYDTGQAAVTRADPGCSTQLPDIDLC